MPFLKIPKEMIQRYLERRKADLRILEESFSIRDPTVIKRISHQLKGNALSYGFDELNDIVVRLEKAAMRADWPVVEESIEEFARWLERQENDAP